MSNHLRQIDSIHSFDIHRCRGVEWSGSVEVEVYDSEVYGSADVTGRITNGSATEVLKIIIVNKGTSYGLDVHRVAVGGGYMGLNFSAGVDGGKVKLRVENEEAGEANQMVYCVIPLP